MNVMMLLYTIAIKMYHECRTDKNNQIKDIYLLIATGRF